MTWRSVPRVASRADMPEQRWVRDEEVVTMHVRRLSERTRFILRRGVLRWGILAGLVITIFVVHEAAAGVREGGGRELLRLAVLALLSFSEWSIGVGWVVGMVLWSFGSAAEARDQDRTDTHDDGRAP